ncbi:MAG: cytochrome-c oxidase, cbb3-type subunit III [unclassified Hahellaceae]|nr:cytochrome-c oxidase, cbb3-type subunit III [Hahellaceae bacterium]|tara:strand:+ start:99058 stop:99948 length:891 start_codon:yes stop_codon:yes gene_type:complete
MSTFWSVWISVIVLGSIIGCAWLILATRKGERFKDSTEETTGHSFDGIEEYDNPMPMWWLKLFWLTIIFGIIYLIIYPGLGSYKGVAGWTSHGQWADEVSAADQRFAPLYAELAAQDPEQLMKDEEALGIGQRLFANNCAVCHGSGGRGNVGFPDLTDNEWLYGGSHEKILETLLNGRQALMPAWQDVLGSAGVTQVAHYVRGLSGQKNVDEKLAQAGAEKFQQNCVVCHGANGEGNEAFGAPNLSDSIWLYGGTQNIVEMTLRYGRKGRMPNFEEVLGRDRLYVLAAYVKSLSQQ